jgi:hypothetical protein
MAARATRACDLSLHCVFKFSNLQSQGVDIDWFVYSAADKAAWCRSLY